MKCEKFGVEEYSKKRK